MVGHQTLSLAIGVRVPASQPNIACGQFEELQLPRPQASTAANESRIALTSQDFPNLASESVGGKRLFQERGAPIEHSMTNNRVIGVARHVEHAHFGSS